MRLLSNRYAKTSFSQCGEDLIVQFALKALGVSDVSYLDIGTHHPVHRNNTYGFYRSGYSGVCIEPNPVLFRKIKKKRPRDLCLQAGLADRPAQNLTFYVMKKTTLSTFSEEEMKNLSAAGIQVKETLSVPIIPVDELVSRHLEKCPNFVSIDCEGLDEEILHGFRLDSWRPDIFSIETITYTRDNSEIKRQGIIDYMLENNYMVIADTYINTIFIDRDKWRNRSNS